MKPRFPLHRSDPAIILLALQTLGRELTRQNKMTSVEYKQLLATRKRWQPIHHALNQLGEHRIIELQKESYD